MSQEPAPFLLDPKNASFRAQADCALPGEKFTTLYITVNSIVLALAVLGGGGWVLYQLLAGDLRTPWMIHQEGVAAEAVVTGRLTGEQDYFLAYTFEVDEAGAKKTYAGKSPVFRNQFASLQKGSTLPVLYARNHPEISLAKGQETQALGKYLMFLPALFPIVLMPVALAFMVRYRKRLRRLAREGQILTGEIVECKTKQAKQGLSLKVGYRFNTPDGFVKEGQQEAIRNDLKNQALPEAETPVQVLYVDDKLFRLL